MLIQELRAFAETLDDLPPTLYVERPLRYVVDLDADPPVLIRRGDEESRKRALSYPLPDVQRAVAIRPLLFADNAEYTFGLARDGSKPERVASVHAAYLDLARRCAETGDEAVGRVLDFLEDDPLARLDLSEDFDRGEKITFRVDGQFVTDRPAVRRFWAKVNEAEGDAPLLQCAVCLQERPALERLQAKIKGIPGGQTSGTALISANSPAFESHGLTASLVAPTCAECGERLAQGCNALLASREHSRRIGGVAFVFWARDGTQPIDLAMTFDDPTPEKVGLLYDSVHGGGARDVAINEERWFAAALSASGGRAVVRDWVDTTVGNARRSLLDWFESQRIVDWSGETTRHFPLWQLANATVPRGGDVPKPLTRLLMRTALTGTPLPQDVLLRAVQRTQAERRVHEAHAALIKMTLLDLRPERREGSDTLVALNEQDSSVAYQCGRLFAVLEQTQERAIPGVGASVADRYFKKASTAPRLVFGPLVSGAQPHLAKLHRDNRGAYVALQEQLERILERLPPHLPVTLNPEQQGEFVIGYYHQRASSRAAARARAASRASGDTSTTQNDDE